jgi:hypothetical protein
MACKHLKELFEICQQHNLKLSSTDLIRIVCPSCGVEEVCPSVLSDEYDARHDSLDQDRPEDSPEEGQ